MQLNREYNTAQYQINAYSENTITINNQQYYSSIILMPNYLAKWHITDIKLLDDKEINKLLEFKPEIILLSCGNSSKFPHNEILTNCAKYGIEIMNHAALCRTYTALLNEQRNILAAVIIAP